MANKKISSLGSLGGTPDVADIIPITDVSDTTGSVNGTTKKVTVANLMSAGLFSDIVSETTTARTLSDSDCGKVIDCSNGSAVTITIPSTVSAGFNCTVVQSGVGQVTIAAGASVNLYCYSSAKATAGQYASINIIPYASNSYVLEGDLAASGGGGGGLTNTYSLSFDGTDDKVSIAHDSSLNLTTALTISAWVKYTSGTLAGYPQILSKRSGNTSYQLNIKNTGELYFGVDGTSFVTANTALSAGTWHHVAVTWTSGTGAVAFYLDGAADGTGTSKTTMSTNAGVLEIGKNPSFSNWYTGLMDEFALFNSVLSASDITSIYNSGVPGDISSLSPVSWWRMGDNDGGTGTTITDQGSGGNDGTLVSGPTFSTDTP